MMIGVICHSFIKWHCKFQSPFSRQQFGSRQATDVKVALRSREPGRSQHHDYFADQVGLNHINFTLRSNERWRPFAILNLRIWILVKLSKSQSHTLDPDS